MLLLLLAIRLEKIVVSIYSYYKEYYKEFKEVTKP